MEICGKTSSNFHLSSYCGYYAIGFVALFCGCLFQARIFLFPVAFVLESALHSIIHGQLNTAYDQTPWESIESNFFGCKIDVCAAVSLESKQLMR